MQCLEKKMEKINAEVESLKAVLELKNQEVHSLRTEKGKLELKLEEFDQIREDLKKAIAAKEDLLAQIQTKNSLER